ncbi:unnamed protein product [Rotaria sp. Silwood1]|nr:unnamed protein product [Rotaria sp. Silwood1]
MCAKHHHISDRQILANYTYEQPQIITEPKSDWHYRSLKDLLKNHIPLLSGEGPQRTPIRVQIPEKSMRPMYLAIAVVTQDHKFHDSKVIVPPKTRVREDRLSHNNDLGCLDFDACSRTDYFDPITRHVYLYINEEEHISQLKEVRIHMFNLYQNQTITKEIIETRRLDLCKLAFWLCYLDNGHFISISQPSFSCVIREKKTINRSRVSQPIRNHKNPFYQLSIDFVDDSSPDNKNDDSDHDMDC